LENDSCLHLLDEAWARRKETRAILNAQLGRLRFEARRNFELAGCSQMLVTEEVK
jgi:hypothetical protein